ncbi:MAP3K12-binding inhibitory protein 1 [Smittium culicis]|uniref:MAP3K12-binding inhibitory protein 1 n=1 Tax=Smittium culicis TaxID=133412 RepID=A0A1R1X9L8_9FUNG|nr:MAP3K12-binding inhibitory protein 1 [Smittium culicis]
MTHTFRALGLEASIFGKAIETPIFIEALKKLSISIDTLKNSLDQNKDCEWIDTKSCEILDSNNILDKNDKKNVLKKIDNLQKNFIQVSQNKDQVLSRMDHFTSSQKEYNNYSNNKEFLITRNDDSPSCARADASQINRGVQIQTEKVENIPGYNVYSEYSKQINSDQLKKHDNFSGIEERLLNIEHHLNLSIEAKEKFKTYQRIKLLEDKLVQLERDYPKWSESVFNQPGKKSSSSLNGKTSVSMLESGEIKMILPNNKQIITSISNSSQSKKANRNPSNPKKRNALKYNTIKNRFFYLNLPKIYRNSKIYKSKKNINNKKNIKLLLKPQPTHIKNSPNPENSMTMSIIKKLSDSSNRPS